VTARVRMNAVKKLLLALAIGWTVTAHAVDSSPHKSAFVNANGVKLHYLEWRGGPKGVLLMLAGLGNDAHVFDDFAVKFTDQYRVVAMTRRGFGESDKPATGYDVKTRVEDVRAFLDALGIRKVTLIGHSVAGDELTGFASAYPNRVDKVVYLDAAYDRSKLEALMRDDPVAKLAPPRQPIAARIMNESFAFHPDYRALRAPALSFYAIPRLHPAFRKAPNAEALQRMNAWWTAKGIPHIRANIEQFRREARLGQVVELPYADHFVFLHSSQDEVVRRTRAFLAR